MKVGSESRFIQSQALIVGQFRISLSHLPSATPPSPSSQGLKPLPKHEETMVSRDGPTHNLTEELDL